MADTVDQFFEGFICSSIEELETTKTCVSCKQTLPLSAFRPNNIKRGILSPRGDCLSCEKNNKVVLQNIKKNGDYPPMPDACEMCGSHEKLRLDHCHETGEFRGWFCDTCNRGIAIFGDNSAGLRRAAEILEQKEREMHERIKNRITVFGDNDG